MSVSHHRSQAEGPSRDDLRPDGELLQRFHQSGDEEAFSAFVRRHVDLVFSTALRQLAGDAHLAHDVTQSVFTDAARKARGLAAHRALSGWLYTSACYAAAKAVRTEQRRRRREEEAQAMNETSSDPSGDAEWRQLQRVLDQALRELKSEDREALLLRFFEAQGFKEIGSRLDLTENAARMRVERAVEKLRGKLARHGITSTAAALSGTLTVHAITAAPAGLGSSVAAAAVSSFAAGGTAAAVQWLALHKAVAVSTLALLTATAADFEIERRDQKTIQSEQTRLVASAERIAQLRADVETYAQTAREVATLRRDDAELDRLSRDAADLAARLRKTRDVQTQSSSPSAAAGGTKDSSLYSPSQLDVKPQVKSQAEPAFPIEATRAGIAGSVTLSFVVTAEGEVTNLVAVDSSHKTFEAPALEAVKRWTFTPGMKNGKPVATRITVPMRFSSKDAPTDWF